MVNTEIIRQTVPENLLLFNPVPYYQGRNGEQITHYTERLIYQLGKCHVQLNSIKQWSNNGTKRQPN